jgi:hypothetical protein
MTFNGARVGMHAFRGLLALSLAAGLAAAARADLVVSSPFLPAGSQGAAGAAGPAGPIELRGISAVSDGVSVCIYDVAKKRSFWVGLNEAGHDFVVKAADPGSDSVTVDYQGRPLKLTLRAAKVASSGSGAAAGTAASAVASPVALNPTPADEQRRLEAVAQEVRRRRLEREKAVQESQPGQGPGGAPPPSPNR